MFYTAGPSFKISDETRGAHRLLHFSVSRSSLLFLYLPSHATFHSIITHFPSQLFPLSLAQLFFLFAALLLPSVAPPPSFIQCSIISHLRPVSFLVFLRSFLFSSLSSSNTHSFFSELRFTPHHPRLFLPSSHTSALG